MGESQQQVGDVEDFLTCKKPPASSDDVGDSSLAEGKGVGRQVSASSQQDGCLDALVWGDFGEVPVT